ncbi:hypothetical protein [Prevotella falsenii]|uniref:hypothetical protein n=1 Tax=Prevotella falsenii TaxID=515414 RepID=UPI0012EBDABA|nr:hypothetical protein [Prevotella falsenii]
MEREFGTSTYGYVQLYSNGKSGHDADGIVNFPAATGGGVYYDGKLKYLYYLNSYGYVIMFLYTYDTETWQMPTNPVQIQTYEFYAVSTTYDPITKKAYGCYYNQDGTQLEIAQVDYETMTHTKLAATDTTYYGFAANKQGEIYAISEGGNLYKVDKTNGAVTKIGFTGVKPDKYVQSAAFDMRTGKLYWASQETNGSHLYEVNTQTGAATRIGSFPDHEEVTCLYVPCLWQKTEPPQWLPTLHSHSTMLLKVAA